MIIKEIANYVAKGIWLLIEREGKMTPAEIKAAGYPHRTVFDALAYLRAGGFVIKLQAGLYAVSESAASRTNSAASRIPSAADRTDSEPSRTECGEPHSPCAADRTNSAASRTVQSQRNIYKQNKRKERKEENFDFKNTGEKSTENLSVFVSQLASDSWQKLRDATHAKLKEKNLSPDLVDRVAFAVGMKFPGCGCEAEINEIITEAEERQKAGKVSSRWVHVASVLKKVYEKSGWEWTPCRSSREVWMDVRHDTQRAKDSGAAVLNPLILRIEEIESERKLLWHRRTVGYISAEEFKAQREALDAEFLALKLKVSGVTLKLKEPEPAATPLAEAVAGTSKKRRLSKVD